MEKLEQVKEILERPFSRGTFVVNCVVHDGPLDKRPKDCPLCRADLENQFNFALRVNEFLNKNKDEALEVIKSGGATGPDRG